ncbi:MAG: V-type ATPase 116kDa subunit family protein, partial [Bacteroidia bacterium]|nr:V-type ATPase 116kDa subunit family protein [Bacteroidia bacterium]
MKKFVFLAYHKDYDRFLHELRDLGLIHVAGTDRTIEDEDLNEFFVRLKQLKESQKILERQIDKKTEIAFNEPDTELGETIPQKIELIQNQKTSLNQQLQVSIKERDALLPWGDFEPESIKQLEKEGYRFNFFIVPDNQYNPDWETLYNAVIVKRETSKTYFVTVTKNDEVAVELNLESIKMPEISLTQLNELIASLREKVEKQDEKLKKLATDLPSLKAAIDDFERKINFTKVRRSSTSLADDKLMMLQGWAPEDNQKEISDYLESKAVYYEVSDPAPEDNVPVKLVNNRFSRLFEPITKMFALPVYGELDPTPFFAPFFMLFFGLCMGDAGYGLIILGVATYFKMKNKNSEMKGIFELFQWFGGATFVVATVTGTFFGIPLFGAPLLQTFYTRLLGAGEGADSAALAQLMQDKLMIFAIAIG